MTRFGIFLIAWGLTFSLAVIYVVMGSMNDMLRAANERRKQRVLDVLSIIVFESDEEAARVHERAAAIPRGLLLAVIQSLAVDLNGQARDRLQQLVRALGLERFIRRRASSRRWRMRTQAAQLQYLIVHPDFDRRALLTDRHHIVRARAVESLTPGQGREHLDLLITMFDDDSMAVQLAVQQKLVELGSSSVPAVLGVLRRNKGGVREALEVAANIADPRLVEALDNHARSADPIVREVAARALGNGGGPGAELVLERLCRDDDADVRVAAVAGLALMESLTSVSLIGRCLRDASWLVRRSAGLALDRLGPPGRLMLRTYLHDTDPYARDMARQMLDAAAARDGLVLFAPLNHPELADPELADPERADPERADPELKPQPDTRELVAVGDAPAATWTDGDWFGSLDDDALEALLGPAPEAGGEA